MGTILVILSALCFGTAGTWIALIGDTELGTAILTATRLLFMALLSYLFCRIRKISLKTDRKEFLHFLVFGCFGQGLTLLLYDYAAREMSVGATALCHFTYPLLVALASSAIDREKIGKMKIIAAVLMLGGLSLTAQGGAVTVKGVAYAFASAVTFASYVYALDHTLLRDTEPLKLTFYNALLSAILMILFSALTRSLVIPRQTNVYGLMFCGAVAGVLGNVFLTTGIRYTGATKAAFLSILEPASAFVWDVVIFGTRLGIVAVIGILMTFLSFFAVLMDRPSGKTGDIAYEREET